MSKKFRGFLSKVRKNKKIFSIFLFFICIVKKIDYVCKNFFYRKVSFIALKVMVTHVSMLLILTAVAANTLIQAYFPVKFGQNGKLSRPELITFRAGGAVYLPLELMALKFSK